MVLPWVPATASTRRPAITDLSPAERGRIRRPRRSGLEHLGVVLAGGGRDHDGVGVADVLGGVAEVERHAELAQRRRGGESWPSLPVTAMPWRAMIRAIAGEPGAADADEVDAAESVGRQDLVGDRDPHERPAASRIIRASFSSASQRDQVRRGRAHRLQPRRVGQQRHGVRRDPVGVSGVVDQQPAAGVDRRRGR